MKITSILTFLISICALHTGAQTFTSTYVELADSADQYIKLGQWHDAERVIIRALRHEPANKSNYLLWSNLSLVRTELENYPGAIEACDIGLTTAPRSTILLTNRARAYMGLGDTSAAIKDLDSALEEDSTLQWPRKMSGILRASKGDLEGAKKDLTIYLESNDQDIDAIETLGDIDAGKGNAEKALARYREAYSLEPNERLLTKLLLTAHAFGLLEEQRDTLIGGMIKYPTNGNLYIFRALLHKSKFENEAAEKDLETAKKLKADAELLNLLLAPNLKR